MCVTSVPPEYTSKYSTFQSNHSRKFVLFHSTTFFPITQNEGEPQSLGIYISPGSRNDDRSKRSCSSRNTLKSSSSPTILMDDSPFVTRWMRRPGPMRNWKAPAPETTYSSHR